jgi:hypothetical protein
MSADGKAGVQQQDAAIGPRCEEAAVLWGRTEGRVVIGETFVDVFEGRGSGGRCADGETKPVGLVQVVVGVLA